ncbi:MAG: glycosyltransferase family 4 protein [Planctomycetota bacterium]|jgi:glycosyltransferase involved in cell wall biosynthesis
MAAKSPASTDELRVVILNQYYVPDVASTGQLLSELADYLVGEGAHVNVITTQPSYGPPETRQRCPRVVEENGIRVVRMWSTRFTKDSPVGRTINSLTFLVQLTARLLFRMKRGEVFLYTTNPPYLGVIGGIITLFRKHPYVVLLHDSYPQLTELVGMIPSGGLVDRLWHRCNRFMYKRAEQSIVLCKAARRLVCDTYDIDPQRVHIVHNWADPNKIRMKPKTENEFAREHGLVEPFTVLYSGNLGLYYDFKTILDTAELLRDENFRLVFIGAGGRRDWIAEQIEQRNLTNTLLLPYQPFERLPESLTACDASLVTIQEGVEGISYPSKLYASLAVGQPILAISEPGSELYDQVIGNDVGYWFELGDAEGLADRIRKMMRDPRGCKRMGRRARELFEREYTRDASAAKYKKVLRQARATW